MCEIIEEYAKEYAAREKAEQLISHVECVAKKLGGLEIACDTLGITMLDYEKAKELTAEVCV